MAGLVSMIHGPPAFGCPTAFARTSSSLAQAGGFALRIGVLHGNQLCGELIRTHCIEAWGCDVVVLEHSVPEGLQSIECERPDIVVVGHHPPTVDCLEVLPALKRYAGMKIVVSAHRITEFLVHRLTSLSFHAVMEESSSGLTELHTAIAKVREGLRQLSPRYLNLAARLRSNPEAFPKLLSARQEQVLICIAHELEDEEIAKCLGMSVATAQRHRNDIMRKLGLHKTTRLIRYCAQAGFDEASLPRK